MYKSLMTRIWRMKADAKARFSEVIDLMNTGKSGEKAKSLLSSKSVVLS